MNQTTIANMQLTESGSTLVIRQSPKSRVTSALATGFGTYMMFGMAYAGVRIHLWWLGAIAGIFFLLGLMAFVFGILRGGDRVTIDREAGQVSRNGKPARQTSEIAGLTVVKSGGVIHAKFLLASGQTEAIVVVSGFTQEAEARRYAQVIANFLGVPVTEPRQPAPTAAGG